MAALSEEDFELVNSNSTHEKCLGCDEENC